MEKQEHLTPETDIKWLRYLRVFATIAVIIVHVSMDTRYNNMLNIDLLYGAFSRFCVPAFVMISGALLLPKELELGTFTKKWAVRIILPFLFWSLVYIIYNIRLRMAGGEVFTLWEMVKATAEYLMKNTANFHFWYIYMIIGIYLFIPVVGRWARHCTDQELIYFLLIWFWVQIFQVPYLSQYSTAIDLSNFAGYLGYLILGYYLGTRTIHYNLLTAFAIMISGYLVTVLATSYFTRKEGNFVHTYYDYLRPNIIFLSAGIFMLTKKLDFRKIDSTFIRKFVHAISRHSYGIYLSHWLVIIYLSKWMHIKWNMIHPLLGIPLTTLACLLVALIITAGLSKIPFVGKYISG